jgi:uncharacterized protein (DUF2062 family)
MEFGKLRMQFVYKFKLLINGKYLAPVKNLLMMGTSPKSVAFGISAAVALGLFPVVGTTTIIITLFALLFRLNLPLMQMINYTVFPLQIIMVVPLMKLGEIIFGFEKLNYTAGEIATIIGTNIPNAFELLFDLTMQAIGAWILIAPIITYILFIFLHKTISKIAGRVKGNDN